MIPKRPRKEDYLRHKERQEHSKSNSLRDVILGGQDGLVDALGIILGLSAVSSDTRILIAAVLAGVCAEAISMGAVAYTSAVADQDHYEAERAREFREVDEEPEMEREEIREIYEAKGFKGKVLEEIVSTITADREMWVNTMMNEELMLYKIDTKAVLKSSIIVGIATFIGGIIPLSSFFFFEHSTGLIISVLLSAITLFAIGSYQAITLVGSWWKTGLRMLVIGLSAALFGYLIASLFQASGMR